MRKTILLSEDQVDVLKERITQEPSTKLAPFIYKKIKERRTSLGENDALPPDEDTSFEYAMLKSRLLDVAANIQQFDGIENYDEEYLTNRLSELLRLCIEIETPVRTNLEKVCANAILRVFGIPQSTVNFKAELVDVIEPEHQFRIKPEPLSNRKFDYENIDDFDNMSKAVLKRRLINALIQGASYVYSTDETFYADDLNSIDKRLLPIYREINAINDYLLFIKEEKITDENHMQAGCVEVHLGKSKEKSIINAQALIFPFLFHELLKGFLELFASHGLPEDDDKAHFILKQSDFLLAEPWDLRIGVNMWNLVIKDYNYPEVLPYFFRDLCELPVKKFNKAMQEILAHTVKGQHIVKHMIKNAFDELEVNYDVPMIQIKDANEALIIDDVR